MSAFAWRNISGLALVALIVLIWTRPFVLALPLADTLPLLAGFGLAIWLGNPWKPADFLAPPPAWIIPVGSMLLAFGLVGQVLVLATFGFAVLVLAWVRTFYPATNRDWQWLTLIVFAFPWLAVDGSHIGWTFRMSGAHVTEFLFGLLGFVIQREGTLINIQGLPVAIEQACAGMNLLPALFLAGAALGLIHLGGQRSFWWFLLLLFPVAWLANTLRIVIITGIALTWGADFASGFFHTWGALIVLGIVFAVCMLLVRFMREDANPALA